MRKELTYTLNGAAYGTMLIAIATHGISACPLVQEILMGLAGGYLLICNVSTYLGRR